MIKCKHIAEHPLSTVAAHYEAQASGGGDYQSEAELEAEFIRLLQSQGYEYVDVRTQDDLLRNLRRQMEALNDYRFSEHEWQEFCDSYLLNKNDGITEKTEKIQQSPVYELKDEQGRLKRNIRIIDKDNLSRNRCQIINQYKAEGEGATGEKRQHRYDVSILVNGLPLVHIELKRRGIALQEAFNQISRYSRESFWAASGVFDYAQIFVISNGTYTKYYANTTRRAHIERQAAHNRRGKAGDSFEFTSWWADAQNNRIADLRDFGKTFFGQNNLLNILTKYCVFDTDKNLKILRPYQIAATERVLNKIALSFNHRLYGTNDSGGYIWHTTGSGKTLTSFKCATLARNMDCVEKVLFVVDRKDLDYQTVKEYNSFQEGCVQDNKNTRQLSVLLERTDKDASIIITTIQKLDRFIKANKGHEVFSRPIVLIFDECHRSQFGDMQGRIARAFKKYSMFGFTGTPIFESNAGGGPSAKTLAAQSPKAGGIGLVRTTEQIFGKQLHSYTIVDAIDDGNVLKFRVDFIDTVKAKDIADKQVAKIARKEAELAPERVRNIVAYILQHFDQKTLRNSKSYTVGEKRLRGFNSIFAVSSIDAAKAYYRELMKQQGEKPEAQRLKLGLIYSYAANEANIDISADSGEIDDENFELEMLDISSRDFLAGAIAQYNADFNSTFSTDSDGFQNYYKDLSKRVRDREIDLLIVVNMFLTGFDAKTLNTLWVDKNLRYHGLLQAFSRTNRILNSVKTYGNIVCFRDLEEETNKALALFGNKNAKGIVLLKSFTEYYSGYENAKGELQPGYIALIADLKEQFPLSQQMAGEEAEKNFIRLFGAILKLKNILSSFDDFADKEILSAAEFQDYQSRYLDLYDKLRKIEKEGEAESITEDVVFQMELVKQVTYGIDYILDLIIRYKDSHGENRELLADIDRAISSSPELRSKKDLIEQFITGLNSSGDAVRDDWHKFVKERRAVELEEIIAAEQLKPEQTRRFVDLSFRNGEIRDEGEDLANCLPPVSLFGGKRARQKRAVLAKLRAFFEKYFGI